MSIPKNIKDITGQQFGRLTAVRFSHFRQSGKQRIPIWECVCSCGNTTYKVSHRLTKGATRSCGCFQRESAKKMIRQNLTKHQLSSSPEYTAWAALKQRCNNPKNPGFHKYGGRGIKVCDRWMKSFEHFYTDMGPRPIGASLDRINTNGNYEPANCRWTDIKTQNRNLRSNRLITIGGVIKTVSEWAEYSGVEHSTIHSRIRYGKTGHDLIAPVHQQSSKDE